MTGLIAAMRRSDLISAAGTYTAFNIAAALFPFLVLPVLTRTVGPADYGIYGLFLAAISMAYPLISLGLETAVGRRFVDQAAGDFPRYVTTAILMATGAAVVVVALATAAGPWIAAVLIIPAMWFWAIGAAAWCEVTLAVVLVVLQMRGRALDYGLWRIGRAALVYLALVTVVLIGFRTWQTLIATQALCAAGLGVWCVLWLRRDGLLTTRASFGDARHALGYGAPLVAQMFAAALLTATDRVLVAKLIGTDAAGLYTVGAQLAQVMYLVSTALNRAWVPWFYGQAKVNDSAARRRIVVTGAGFAAGLTVMALALGAVGYWAVPVFVGSDMAGATPVFVWLLAAWVAHGVGSLISARFYYDGRTGWVATLTMTAALLNIALNFWLIPLHGIIGAAQATLLAYTTTAVLAAVVVLTSKITAPASA